MSIGAMANFWLKGIAGNTTIQSDGSEVTGRFGRLSDLIVSELQGKYYEAAKRGNTFAMTTNTITTTTIAAGNIYGAAAAATTQFGLWNPVNSGRDVVLMKFWAQVVSGTVPAGPLWHAYFNAGAVSIAGAGTIVNVYSGSGQVGGAKDVSAGGAGVAITGGGKPYPIRPSLINFSAGSYANLSGATQAYEPIDGDLILAPGTGWVPLWSGAGTTVIGWYGLTYVEVPI